MICPNCGNEIQLSGDMKFCPSCGADLPDIPPELMPLKPEAGGYVTKLRIAAVVGYALAFFGNFLPYIVIKVSLFGETQKESMSMLKLLDEGMESKAPIFMMVFAVIGLIMVVLKLLKINRTPAAVSIAPAALTLITWFRATSYVNGKLNEEGGEMVKQFVHRGFGGYMMGIGILLIVGTLVAYFVLNKGNKASND